MVIKLKNVTKSILLAAGMLCMLAAAAQHYDPELDEYDPEMKRRKLGIRVGFGYTKLNSPQFVNAGSAAGLHGAFYYRKNISKGFHFNPELGASIKGSKFNNGDTGYSRISLFYFDIALLGMINLDNKNVNSIVVGIQGSRLMRSSLFVGREQFASFLQLPFKPWDFSAVLGYHFNTNFIGFNLSLKYGLYNIAGDFANFDKNSVNGSMKFKDVKPSLANVTDVKNLSIEFSLYF